MSTGMGLTCLAVNFGVRCELMAPGSIEGGSRDGLNDAIATHTDLRPPGATVYIRLHKAWQQPSGKMGMQ